MKVSFYLLFLVPFLGSSFVHGAELIAPPAGSPLRETILNDLRAAEPTVSTQKEKKQKIIFEKVDLRVSGEWAWVSASPRTEDNKWRSEPLTGLLHHQTGRWRVVEYLGDEVSAAHDPVAAYRTWRATLLKKNPQCPPQVIPVRP